MPTHFVTTLCLDLWLTHKAQANKNNYLEISSLVVLSDPGAVQDIYSDHSPTMLSGISMDYSGIQSELGRKL
jgi:hypothetical protein